MLVDLFLVIYYVKVAAGIIILGYWGHVRRFGGTDAGPCVYC